MESDAPTGTKGTKENSRRARRESQQRLSETSPQKVPAIATTVTKFKTSKYTSESRYHISHQVGRARCTSRRPLTAYVVSQEIINGNADSDEYFRPPCPMCHMTLALANQISSLSQRRGGPAGRRIVIGGASSHGNRTTAAANPNFDRPFARHCPLHDEAHGFRLALTWLPR